MKNSGKVKLVSRNYLILIAVNLFFSTNVYLLFVITPEFAMNVFHASSAQAGLAASAYMAGALLTRLVAAKLLSRFGYKRTIVYGCVVNTVMCILYFFVRSIPLLIVVRFLNGIAYALVSTAAATILSHVVPSERRGEGIGYFALCQTLSNAIGPFLSIKLSGGGNYNLIFGMCVLISVFSVIPSALLSVKAYNFTEEQREDMPGFKISSLLDAGAFRVSLTILLAQICFAALSSFMKIFTENIGLAAASAYFFLIYVLAAMISRPGAGRLSDSKGEKSMLYPGIIVNAVGFLLFALSKSSYMLFTAAIFIGLGLGTIQSITQTLVVKITPSHRLGPANATYYLCIDLGNCIGPILAGLLIPFTGYGGMFMAIAGIAFFTFFEFWFVYGRRAN
ncbi:MFS transporter [Sediminispirochaeta smaragdinae]|uniref:Major facilitator superfamily MFS_1 n=1 Tax=Sediminispirochaeta smaragdinae (strain DSM 11293 / JCM 15392 / SEBR 4228) TaxID=573413 RepID=E1R9V5_SEDSS|nr:MFS transporter [Sediminispirochaeta smaragdinae]ADK83274.1 major facilitator superfamily MFS_1 [Sediminispirochaeta smaragdinae DSM 11293]